MPRSRQGDRRLKLLLLGEAVGADEGEEVGVGLLAEEIVAILLHLFALRALEQIAALGERGDQRDGICTQPCSCAASNMRA